MVATTRETSSRATAVDMECGTPTPIASKTTVVTTAQTKRLATGCTPGTTAGSTREISTTTTATATASCMTQRENCSTKVFGTTENSQSERESSPAGKKNWPSTSAPPACHPRRNISEKGSNSQMASGAETCERPTIEKTSTNTPPFPISQK